MSSSADVSTEGLEATIQRLSEQAAGATDEDLAALSETALQTLVRVALAVNFAKIEAGRPSPLISRSDAISATAVMSGASGLLKSANLEIFELGMWEAWSGRH